MHSKQDDIYYVYALVDPINNIPFYIGKGKEKRCYDHTKGYDKKNIKKVNYIENIRDLGFEPKVELIKSHLTNSDALRFESTCIQTAKSMRIPLTNIKTNEGTHSWSKASRKKLSVSMKQRGYMGGIRKGQKWSLTKKDSVDKDKVLSMLKAGIKKKDICEKMNISYYVLQGVIKSV